MKQLLVNGDESDTDNKIKCGLSIKKKKKLAKRIGMWTVLAFSLIVAFGFVFITTGFIPFIYFPSNNLNDFGYDTYNRTAILKAITGNLSEIYGSDV